MAYECIFDIELPEDPALKVPLIEAYCELLVMVNMGLMHERGTLPALADSGVRYERSRAFASQSCSGTYCEAPRRIDRWQCVTKLYERGSGDCKDLSAARVAEQRRRGVPCRCRVLYFPGAGPEGTDIYHVDVEYAERDARGRPMTEDPSIDHGMVPGEYA